MKNTSLRIGNLVFFDSKMAIGKHVEIATIENHGVRVFNGAHDENGNKHLTMIIPYSEIRGICLTKKWLLEKGFVFGALTEQGEFYSKGQVEILASHVTKRFSIVGDDMDIEYVHQLQNLYFALTGKEL